jgi:nicotinamide-nucleotide amidase
MAQNLIQLAESIANYLIAKNLYLVSAESCTGGGIAYLLTEIPGSSIWFERGYVTYSNDAKKELLNVTEDILNNYGAVSRETAQAMAEGALQNSHAHISIAVTGIAGPDGGTKEKPVGTVWFGWARMGLHTKTALRNFTGDRHAIREQAIQFALEELVNIIQ